MALIYGRGEEGDVEIYESSLLSNAPVLFSWFSYIKSELLLVHR